MDNDCIHGDGAPIKMIYYNHNNISREAKIIILKRRYSIRSLQNLTHEKVQCCCFWKTGSESLQQQGFILDCFLVIIKTYSPVFVHVHLLQGEVDDILGNTINIIVLDVVFLHLDPVLALLLLALELEALLQQRRHLLLGDDPLAGQVVHGEAVPDLLLVTLDWERRRFEMFRTNTPRVKLLLIHYNTHSQSIPFLFQTERCSFRQHIALWI